MTTTAQDLISRSISQGEIVHAEWTEELETDLVCESEDSVRNDGTLELWGTTESGSEWRVHLDAPAAAEQDA